MHDPLTVAFEIRSPFKQPPDRFFPKGYRPSWATIWHRDPEKRGDDDSCDWFATSLTDAETEAGLGLLTNEFDNVLDAFEQVSAHRAERVMLAQWRAARRFYRPRPWYKHPRWHIRHWRLQVHPLQAFCRWMWSRCAGCGGHFSWGYSPISDFWESDGPRLFKGEPGVRHHECSQHRVAVA